MRAPLTAMQLAREGVGALVSIAEDLRAMRREREQAPGPAAGPAPSTPPLHVVPDHLPGHDGPGAA